MDERCPLKNIEKKISKKQALKVKKKIDHQVIDAFEYAEKSRFPSKNLLDKFYQ